MVNKPCKGGEICVELVGFVSNEKNKEDVIKKMTSRMFHRGPDGEGYYTDSKIALGHRRLAIIDIEMENNQWLVKMEI